MFRRLLPLLILTAVISACGVCRADEKIMVPASLLFEYDREAPLDPEREMLISNQLYERYHISFQSTNNQRVTGWLTMPARGKKPFPCIMVGHGLGGSKQDFEMIYDYLATRGYATLALDAQYHGERKVEGMDILGRRYHTMREVLMQSVVDNRRGLDYLETLPDIDRARTGYLGISMGVLIGAPFVSIDKRIVTAVMLVGGGDFEIIMRDSSLLPFVLLRETSGIPLSEVAAKFKAVDPVNHIQNFAPRPLLMLNGKNDNVVPPTASQALFDAAGQPKKIIWYDSGHIPPFDKVLVHANKWFSRFLKHAKDTEDTTAAQEPDGPDSLKDAGEYSIDFDVSAAGEGQERTVTFSAAPSPAPADDMRVEAVFPAIDYWFEIEDSGERGDEKAGDGVYSITLTIPLIRQGIVPDSMYDCYARLVLAGGAAVAKSDMKNSMLRGE